MMQFGSNGHWVWVFASIVEREFGCFFSPICSARALVVAANQTMQHVHADIRMYLCRQAGRHACRFARMHVCIFL